MKRDFDLIREILKDVENIHAGEYRQEFSYPGYDDLTVYQHIDLLINAGLIKGHSLNEMGASRPGAIIDDLTWAGHDFLDAMKDAEIVNNFGTPHDRI
jgi:hypothetical protein